MPEANDSRASPICLNCSPVVRTGLGVLKSPGILAVAGEKSYLSSGITSAAPMMLRSMPLSCRSSTEAIVGADVADCAGLAALLAPPACAKAVTHAIEHTLTTIAIAL